MKTVRITDEGDRSSGLQAIGTQQLASNGNLAGRYDRMWLSSLLVALFFLMPLTALCQSSPTHPASPSGPSQSMSGGANSISIKPDMKTGPASGSMITPAKTLEIKRTMTGDLSYRFLLSETGGQESSAAPMPLPAASGTNSIVAITLPAGMDVRGSRLEVIDNSSGKVAHLPVITSHVTELSASDFTMLQTVIIPVQVTSKGGLVNATVTLTDGSKYIQSWLLKSADSGVARFNNVPLAVPITATVSSGSDPSVSQKMTLPSNAPADGYHWPVIMVDWPDAKSVPLASSSPVAASTTPVVAPSTPVPQQNSDPLGGIFSTLISLLIIGGIVYGLFWAYKNGHLKKVLDNLGIQEHPVAATGPQGSPFERPERSPIQPITEGTADPLDGQAVVMGVAPIAAAGPRLVGTTGAYAGSIFPILAGAIDIGRDSVNTIALPQDTNASRRHATIQALNGQFTVVDNGSSNGTFINGVRIVSQVPQILRAGDEMQIGMTRFRFEA